jgi:hypothetical protein
MPRWIDGLDFIPLPTEVSPMLLKGFSFHLSSAIVAVFVAGILLALNLIRRVEIPYIELPFFRNPTVHQWNVWGWPFDCCRGPDTWPTMFWRERVAVDALICIGITGAAMVICELILRRIERIRSRPQEK